ncbi:hypothetical protein E2C01_070250 [Portunus trituberculatus]|uniref:Uncharacterized protein n=1 Tax=Portunus trituberculatus TaxID=210409 RepID=A0A5B7I0T8_PORTR|nr:hypothetical protein [Portunus trituberculatus]
MVVSCRFVPSTAAAGVHALRELNILHDVREIDVHEIDIRRDWRQYYLNGAAPQDRPPSISSLILREVLTALTREKRETEALRGRNPDEE